LHQPWRAEEGEGLTFVLWLIEAIAESQEHGSWRVTTLNGGCLMA